MNEKSLLRKRFSDIRASVSDRTAKDASITRSILSLNEVKNADCVLLYASFRSEIDMLMLFGCLRELGIDTAFPLCGKNGEMTFHLVYDASQLSAGAYGIPEPDSSLPQPVITDRTVCIVPGLAFTAYGGRLGYGGGFYDRFLAANPQIITVSAAYEALLTDSLPLMQHDLTVRYIVTEERTVICNEQ